VKSANFSHFQNGIFNFASSAPPRTNTKIKTLAGGPPMLNLFADLPARADAEIVTELLLRKGVRIERIVSTGQSTPADKPYNQDHDEWVLLLTGSAGLWIGGQGERDLRPGDHVLIPAHRPHRVTWTASGGPTVWLAVHFC
jgi:cupin 2 domain-containing protein